MYFEKDKRIIIPKEQTWIVSQNQDDLVFYKWEADSTIQSQITRIYRLYPSVTAAQCCKKHPLWLEGRFHVQDSLLSWQELHFTERAERSPMSEPGKDIEEVPNKNRKNSFFKSSFLKCWQCLIRYIVSEITMFLRCLMLNMVLKKVRCKIFMDQDSWENLNS